MDRGPQYFPFTEDELFSRFSKSDGTSKHLLVLYSLAVGVNAQILVDMGLGQTTGTLRTAAAVSNGTVYSCDQDAKRFSFLLSEQTDNWKLFLEPSRDFIRRVPEPVDFVMHDSAHDYTTVRDDLRALLPKMRRFGIICVHDSQQPDLSRDILAAIKDAAAGFAVSAINIPFGAGLAMIRVEESGHPAIIPASGTLPDGRSETALAPFPSVMASPVTVSRSLSYLRALKMRLGYRIRNL